MIRSGCYVQRLERQSTDRRWVFFFRPARRTCLKMIEELRDGGENDGPKRRMLQGQDTETISTDTLPNYRPVWLFRWISDDDSSCVCPREILAATHRHPRVAEYLGQKMALNSVPVRVRPVKDELEVRNDEPSRGGEEAYRVLSIDQRWDYHRKTLSTLQSVAYRQIQVQKTGPGRV